ncbi:cobalamin-independent synthase [Suillus plorans]|uniref:Cobalamin-independent synthase n=1 Tax=Suillus plorans TaxID=116603 RepID=A0A9P7J293_9AGAM|nr:cobalamin-independent synthase [Suillus plorans]KAG1799425.1 cobalamin-independent synthase [Suillus plorans]
MRPFESGAQLPPNDDDHYQFNFASPVTANLYGLDVRMPVPVRPWRGFAPPSESNASASGSGFQPQQSFVNSNNIQHGIPSQLPSTSSSSFQLQQSLVDANNRQHDIPPQLPSSNVSSFQPQQSLIDINNPHHYIYPQLQSNYGPEAPGYLVPPAYHPILNERQPLGSFFPDFSQPVPSMGNDTLLPVGTEYRDEPRRERIFGVEGTPGQMFSRKRKGRNDKPDTEYINQLPQKRIRLRRSIANAPTMVLADAEQFVVPSWPQLVASPPLFAPPEAGPSTVPSQSVVSHLPSAPPEAGPSTVPSQSVISHLPSAPLESIPFTVPSQSVVSHHLSAPLDSQPFTVPSQSFVSQPPSAPFDSQPLTVPSQSIVSHPPSAPLDSQSFTVPSQPVAAPAVSFPDISELPYNLANLVHQKIVSSATKAIKAHLINTHSLSTHLERRHWVETRLEESATKQYHHPEFGRNWAVRNSATLYMALSDPCKSLMQTCKRIARSKVILYHLHPGVWSMANERQFRTNRIRELLSKGMFPPRFTFGEDEFSNLHFLQNEVVWHVLLDTVAELKIRRHIVNLDSLFCLAAAAVSCALNELENDQFAHIEFMAEGYQEFYNRLLNYLQRMSNDPVFLARWEAFKKRTSARLAQLSYTLSKFPTTTIGSFPQTKEIRTARAKLGKVFYNGSGASENSLAFFRCWVIGGIWLALTSSSTASLNVTTWFNTSLCPSPIIVFDVSRPTPMIVKWSSYAQSVSSKPMKGTLSGAVTILTWSFPHDDVSRKLQSQQLALALRDEVLDLEKAGISVIQVDEPAIREGLPLRRSDWYLQWAVHTFKLSTAGVSDAIQTHSHFYYSDFGDIFPSIQHLNANVISIELVLVSTTSTRLVSPARQRSFERLKTTLAIIPDHLMSINPRPHKWLNYHGPFIGKLAYT